MRTAFTELVGCTAPVQLAPMPGVVTDDLAVAFADAGGLAMLGTPLTAPGALAGRLAGLAARTTGVVGANVLLPFLDREVLAVAADRARVVEFFYGEPDPDLVATARRGGARVGWQVGSVAEAAAAERAGCDYVVAQGVEAGGHVRGVVGLLPLLAQVCGAVACPVVAAGGLATPGDLAAVLAAGAAAGRFGTRFVATAESGAHPRYVELLLAASAEDTVYTEAFSVMWPDAPHRVLASCLAAAGRLENDFAGTMALPEAGSIPVPRYSAMVPTRETTGTIEAMALYAGQSVGAVTSVRPAGELVRELVEGAERLLRAGTTR
jgi:nitronate monooxygenase